MLDQKVKTTLEQAERLFMAAQEELSRPEEDVVPYLVCHKAYESINKYLTGFLLNNGIDVHMAMTLENLLEQCQAIDSKFKSLKLDPLYGVFESSDIWVDVDEVRELVRLATQTRKMVGQA